MIKLIKNKIYVMNKKDVENFQFEKDKKYLIISICGYYETLANFQISELYNNNIDIKFYLFDDVDKETKYYDLQKKKYYYLIPIRKDQAKNIAFLIKENYNKFDYIVVHCNAGMSRSPGIVGAISKYLWNDDSDIFDDKYFTPNMYVYRMLLDSFMKI
jgi:protein-tyrosine phosphatase